MTRVEMDWSEHNTFVAGGQRYFGLEIAGTVHLISARCPHRGGPLHLGRIVDGRVRCPWHGTTFRLDRLCEIGLPSVQRGSHIIAYLSKDECATTARTLVLLGGKRP